MNPSRKIKKYTSKTLPKSMYAAVLHSSFPIDLPWLLERIKPLKSCDHQRGGAVEVCYGVYAWKPDTLLRMTELLHGKLRRSVDILISPAGDDGLPVFFVRNEREPIE